MFIEDARINNNSNNSSDKALKNKNKNKNNTSSKKRTRESSSGRGKLSSFFNDPMFSEASFLDFSQSSQGSSSSSSSSSSSLSTSTLSLSAPPSPKRNKIDIPIDKLNCNGKGKEIKQTSNSTSSQQFKSKIRYNAVKEGETIPDSLLELMNNDELSQIKQKDKTIQLLKSNLQCCKDNVIYLQNIITSKEKIIHEYECELQRHKKILTFVSNQIREFKRTEFAKRHGVDIFKRSKTQ